MILITTFYSFILLLLVCMAENVMKEEWYEISFDLVGTHIYLYSHQLSSNLFNFLYYFYLSEGCFNVAAFLVLHVESPGTIFRHPCCSWDRPVSQLLPRYLFPSLLFPLLFFFGSFYEIKNLLDMLSSAYLLLSYGPSNLSMAFILQLCIILFTWCWSCAGSSPARDLCLENQSKSGCFVIRHALGKS